MYKVNTILTQMGRGRNGLLTQSRKNTKKLVYSQTTPLDFFIKRVNNREPKGPPTIISKELLTAMKKMSPLDLKNALITEQEEVEEVDPNEQEEFDLTGAGEPVYETPILTSNLCNRIMSNEFSEAQVEHILKKSLGF